MGYKFGDVFFTSAWNLLMICQSDTNIMTAIPINNRNNGYRGNRMANPVTVDNTSDITESELREILGCDDYRKIKDDWFIQRLSTLNNSELDPNLFE